MLLVVPPAHTNMLISRSNTRQMQSPTPILILTIAVVRILTVSSSRWMLDNSLFCSDSGEDDEMQMVWAKAGRWIWGLGHVFEGNLYFTKDLVDDSFVPRNRKPKLKPAPKPTQKGKHVQFFKMRCKVCGYAFCGCTYVRPLPKCVFFVHNASANSGPMWRQYTQKTR